MKRAASSLISTLDSCIVSRKGTRCDFPAYFGLPYNSSALNRSVPQTIGPVLFGLHNRGCQDCKGCEPVAWNCSLFEKPLNVEFLGIEFAADVEYVANEYNSTQESVVLGYLKKQVRDNDYVVFNTGIHDTVNVGKYPMIYEQQLSFYTKLLSSVYHRENILWVTSTYPKRKLQPSEWVNITSTSAIRRLNDASRRVMAVHGVDVLDVGFLSTLPKVQELYTDGVHLGSSEGKWYSFVSYAIIHRYLALGMMNCLWLLSFSCGTHNQWINYLNWTLLDVFESSFVKQRRRRLRRKWL